MRGLSPERKKVIKEMGFGDLIEFPIFEIPTKLAFYVVDILNTTNMTLECPMGDIVITPKTGSWTANGEKETGKKRPERVQRSILATVERPVQKCQQAHNKSVIRLLKNVFEGDDVSGIDWCSYIIECASVSKLDWAKKLEKKRCVLWASDVLDVKRRLPAFKSWNTSLLKKIAELQNDYMGIEEIQDDVGEGEEPNQKEIDGNLIKFQDDEKLLQLKQQMKDIFKEPDMPEYLSSSSSESDDDNDDGSQLADENEESYRKETHSNDEDNHSSKNENEKEKAKKEKDQIGSSSQESPVFGIDNSLQGSQQTFDLGASPTYEKMNILSEKKKKRGLKSKYVNKTVDPSVELTEDEKLLGRSIFSTQEEEEEEVFNDDERMILFRINIQSLAPGLEIDTSVIDTQHLLKLDGAKKRLHSFEADLLEEGSFDAAIDGCDGVFHTASPFFNTKELIEPALKGTPNVLGSCSKASSVKRVVVTSSLAAVVFNARPKTPEVVVDET
ncbi:peptidase C48, SUMO/sentrin/Ubl1 [Tanacetum coccineum]|uniref:Peptidase C48, SUMO/sentrin/Ubl1 n=1 Tax=Tanacetum coccineum TaxID=301880 RepID=A0ABQ4Z4Y1_9ASTR